MAGVCTVYNLNDGEELLVIRNSTTIVGIKDNGDVSIYKGNVHVYEGNIVINGNARIDVNAEFAGDVIINGNLKVQGTIYPYGDITQDTGKSNKICTSTVPDTPLPDFPVIDVDL